MLRYICAGRQIGIVYRAKYKIQPSCDECSRAGKKKEKINASKYILIFFNMQRALSLPNGGGFFTLSKKHSKRSAHVFILRLFVK